MPTEEEVYDNFLAHAGKCPKCGDFLFIEKEKKYLNKFYQVSKVCLSCDYKELISNSFNEAMGLVEPRSSLYRIDEKRKSARHYQNIDDPINHTIKCPFCGSVNEFDTQFSIKQQLLIHKCLVCEAEFVLEDMDFETGIGIMKILKIGKPQPDPDLKKAI